MIAEKSVYLLKYLLEFFHGIFHSDFSFFIIRFILYIYVPYRCTHGWNMYYKCSNTAFAAEICMKMLTAFAAKQQVSH